MVKVRGNSSTWTLFDTTPQYLVTTSKKPIEGRVSGSVQLTDMVNDVSDYFAKTYAKNLNAVAGESEKVSIKGIHTTSAFFSLEKQLKKMNSVASVQVNTIQGDKVTYTLSLLGDYQQFNDELLSKNSRITPVIEALIVEPVTENESLETNVGTQDATEVAEPIQEAVSVIDDAEPVIHEYQLSAS